MFRATERHFYEVTNMTDVAKNKELMKSWVGAFNEKDVDRLLTYLADDYVNHAAIPEARHREGQRVLFAKLWKAMPDMKYTLEDSFGEGDRVVCRVTMKGTQTGPLEFKNAAAPATGREVVTEQIHVFRVANGKLAEHWAGRDDIGMMRQLGIGPFAGSK